MKETKKYTGSPLPFRGTKRYYVKRFREVLQQVGDVDTIADLFGGSGLLARVAKDTLPHCRVIYNDFDFYVDRLARIGETNALLHEIAPLLTNVQKKKKVPQEVKRKVLSVILKYQQRGEVDYITLSASLLFSGKWAQSYEQMAKQTMYNMIVRGDYDATNYLNGLEVAHEDYRTLFDAHKDNKRALFVLDPPYLQTEVTAYKEGMHWYLKDYLDVLPLIQQTKYVMFTSGKSQILELCRWLNQNYNAGLLKGSVKYERNSNVSHSATYKDIMIARI